MLNSKLLRDTPLFQKHFSSLKDPRRTTKGNFIYPLDELLFLTVSGVLCGFDEWTSITLFGHSKLEWLRKYFPYKNGIPSHDVLGKVFALLDPVQFNECFIHWVNEISQMTQGEVVCIDGKTLCGSGEKNHNRSPFHMVSAYAAQNRLCLGQQCVSEKSNEITAIPALLEMLDIENCVVTIDAMGCQREIAQKIRAKKADYLLLVKDNQKELKQQIEKMFSIKVASSTHTHHDIGHGRVEHRTCDVIHDLQFLDGRENWTSLHGVVKIQAERFHKQSKQTSHETRYYITSLHENAEQLNLKIRSHWAIENNLHWSLDVLFGEDRSLIKKGNAPINISMIKKMALAMLERERSTKMSKPMKRIKAALNDDYRDFILKT